MSNQCHHGASDMTISDFSTTRFLFVLKGNCIWQLLYYSNLFRFDFNICSPVPVFAIPAFQSQTLWSSILCRVIVFLISHWGSILTITSNQLYFRALFSNFTVSVPLLPLIRYPARLVPNYVSQLNSPLKCSCSSVTPENKWSPDKSWSDIAVLIFASMQALLEPTVSFCSATIKITGQWNILPKGRG